MRNVIPYADLTSRRGARVQIEHRDPPPNVVQVPADRAANLAMNLARDMADQDGGIDWLQALHGEIGHLITEYHRRDGGDGAA